MTSFQRLRVDDGAMTCVSATPCFYVGLCEPGGSRACQRATVTPLLLHHSQFTTKHSHRSVWAYLWGDCKMSMEFGPHCTDLKTLSGTFRTTNGFQWYMTSALSCFSSLYFIFFSLRRFSFSLRSVALLEPSPVLEPTFQMDGKQVSRLCQLFFSKVQQNGK